MSLSIQTSSLLILISPSKYPCEIEDVFSNYKAKFNGLVTQLGKLELPKYIDSIIEVFPIPFFPIIIFKFGHKSKEK